MTDIYGDDDDDDGDGDDDNDDDDKENVCTDKKWKTCVYVYITNIIN